jgi:hypothetical protein
MPALQDKATRRSRFLLDWSAAACLAAKDQALDAITGQAATFSRASVKYALDANGRYRAVPYGVPAFEWATDPVSGLKVPGVFLEASRANLVVQSDICTAGNGWGVGGTTTATANNVYAGRPFTFINNAAGGSVNRTLTFTGNGTKAFSFLIKADGAVTGLVHLLVFDSTTSAFRAQIRCTIAAGGVITATALTGAVLRVESLADGVYRVYAQATGVVAANANRAYACDSGGTTAASYLVSDIQCEDANCPSSLIPTTTTALTRAGDALSFPFLLLTQALTVYVKYVERGTQLAVSGLFEIGTFGVNPSLLSYRFSTTQAAASWQNGTVQVATGGLTGPTLGVQAEDRVALSAAGVVTLGMSLDGGAELTTASPAAAISGASFGPATLTLNTYTGGGIGYALIQKVRIAMGVQSLAYMQAG